MGLGGHVQGLLMRPQFAPENDPRNAIPVEGARGEYHVVFTFARPGYAPAPEREFSMDPTIPGDSHLAIAPPAVRVTPERPALKMLKVYATTDAGDVVVFEGHPNVRGFLGRLETTLTANNFNDAEVKAQQLLAPTLSNWSTHLDVPFWIWRTYVTEVASGAKLITVTNPFLNVPFALLGSGTMTKEFRAFASLYREALGTNSPTYSFLCLFKIAEGIRKRRERIAAENLKQGQKPVRPIERVPARPEEFAQWLNALFPVRPGPWDRLTLDSIFVREARGRKFNDLLDKELVDLRNDIGHAISDESGEPALVADDALHIRRTRRWLPLIRCLVRRMLKNEFPEEFLPYLREDGTIEARQPRR
jgi:hypothetical protein